MALAEVCAGLVASPSRGGEGGGQLAIKASASSPRSSTTSPCLSSTGLETPIATAPLTASKVTLRLAQCVAEALAMPPCAMTPISHCTTPFSGYVTPDNSQQYGFMTPKMKDRNRQNSGFMTPKVKDHHHHGFMTPKTGNRSVKLPSVGLSTVVCKGGGAVNTPTNQSRVTSLQSLRGRRRRHTIHVPLYANGIEKEGAKHTAGSHYRKEKVPKLRVIQGEAIPSEVLEEKKEEGQKQEPNKRHLNGFARAKTVEFVGAKSTVEEWQVEMRKKSSKCLSPISSIGSVDEDSSALVSLVGTPVCLSPTAMVTCPEVVPHSSALAFFSNLCVHVRSHIRMLYAFQLFNVFLLLCNSTFFEALSRNSWDSASLRSAEGHPPFVADPDRLLGRFFLNVHVDMFTYIRNSVVWSLLHLLFLQICMYSATRASKGFWRSTSYGLARLYGLFCATSLLISSSVFLFGGTESKAIGFPDIYLGFLTQWYIFPHAASFGVDTSMTVGRCLYCVTFIAGVAVDLYGFYLLLKGGRKYLHRFDLFIPIAAIGIALCVGNYIAGDIPTCNGNDEHWIDFSAYPQNIDMSQGNSVNYPPVRFSRYIRMRDGIHIAADIYLPKKYYAAYRGGGDALMRGEATVADFTPLPTFVSITRYDRRMTVKWPFTMLRMWKEPRDSSINVWSNQFQQTLVSNDYAVIVLDTRGTGASQGSRLVDFAAEELADFDEIIGWVKGQWWCNGEIGVGGISYDGMTGLQVAAHGSVKAAVSLFTPMDVLGDLLAPGGMVCSSFVRDYSGLTAGFEREGSPLQHMLSYLWHYPLHVLLGFIKTFGGPLPINQFESVAKEALRDHEDNWDMTKMVHKVEFLDDSVPLDNGQSVAVKSFGITENVMQGLASNNVSVYIVGGYCDSAIVRGATRLYDYLHKHSPGSRSKLVLGSWNHSGRRNCSPYSGSYACFEKSMYFDMVRHLDCHLKGSCWGNVLEEAPVHYWQIGEETWYGSETFPPTDMKYVKLDFSTEKFSNFAPPTSTMKSEEDSGEFYAPRRELHVKEEDNDEQVIDYENRDDLFEYAVHDFTQNLYLSLQERPAEEAAEVPLSHRAYAKLSRDPNAYQLGTSSGLPSAATEEDAMATSSKAKDSTIAVLSYPVDYQATTGIYTRWLVAQHPFRLRVRYGNRLFARRSAAQINALIGTLPNLSEERVFSKLEGPALSNILPPSPPVVPAHPSPSAFSSALSFTTSPISEAVRMVGSPWVTFTMLVQNCTDLSVFAYLEDVDMQSGYSHYVTEGKVVGSHRPTATQVAVGSSEVVRRTFARKDYKPIDGSELIEISLTLEPVSWTFPPGHAIRVSFVGSDVDNFELREHGGTRAVLPEYWNIMIGQSSSFPAWIRLPTL